MEIDSNQQRAIHFTTGSVLVNAGPGSGKTTVLTHRIAFLISEKLASPEEILVITFTSAAASSMKERFLLLCNDPNSLVTFSTFHAFFYQIIRRYYGSKKFSIITTQQKVNVLEEVYNELFLKELDVRKTEEILTEISFVKNFDELQDEYIPKSLPPKQFFHLFYQYGYKLKSMNLIDFDDMILDCLRIVQSNSTFCNQYRERFKYVLMDEFQDINPLQYQTLLTLFGSKHNMFVVGDDDQAIYGFRGSSPKLMFQFLKDYENAQQIGLYTNYRCKNMIVSHATKLISKNKIRFEKDIRSNNSGGEVLLFSFVTPDQECDYIVNELQKLKEEGMWADNAVLFRTNSEAEYICERLQQSKVPYVRREKSTGFYQHFIIKDIFAYLDYSQGVTDRINFVRLMNRPVRYIKRDYIKSIKTNISELLQDSSIPESIKCSLQILQRDIEYISKMEPFAAITYIEKKIGYGKYLRDEALKLNHAYTEYEEVIEGLKIRAKKFSSIKEFRDFVQSYTKETEKNKIDKSPKDAVKIMSMHASKGLEWKNVFLPGCIQGKIPHPQAREVHEIEEERRLFYVAMTRAKSRLCITFCEDKKRYYRSAFITNEVTPFNYSSEVTSDSSDSSSSVISSSNS